MEEVYAKRSWKLEAGSWKLVSFELPASRFIGPFAATN
jgi:hypothetical protein